MFTKKKRHIKKSRFLFWVAIYLLMVFVLQVYADSLRIDILRVFEECQKLDRKIIKKMRFKLSKEQNLIRGENEKYLLKNNNGYFWVFKTYRFPEKVKISRSVYLLAQLLGISTPVIYEITLPVNGKNIYGTVQKFILGGEGLNKRGINELNDRQIKEIQNHQVFDWLICNDDATSDHFIIKPETKEVFSIDKDGSLRNEGTFLIKNFSSVGGYYIKFWNAFIQGIISVNIRDTFKFIEYIQGIDDNEYKKILLLCLDNNKLINEFFLRKQNLKVDFERFYQELSILQGGLFQKPSGNNQEMYSKLVLEKLKESLAQKQQVFDKLKEKEITKQADIAVISSKEAWIIIEKLNSSSKKEYLFCAKKTLENLKSLENIVFDIYEKLAINLYMEEVNRSIRKNDIEDFLQRRNIKRITIHPERISDRKILDLEYNLRTIYGKKRKTFSEYKKELIKDQDNILLHLNYVLFPVRGNNKETKLILKEYEKYIEKYPGNLMYEVLCGVLLRDLNCFQKIDSNFGWKYLGMALVESFKKKRKKAMDKCNKALCYSSNKEVIYWGHILGGLLYQYNDKWDRFQEGFEIKKAVKSYKKALAIKPKSVKAHLNLGILYLIMEKPRKALKEFKKVDRLNPEYGKSNFFLNKINKKGLYKDKKEYLKAVRMNTLSGRHHYILGLAYLIKEDNNLAQKHFDKAREFGYKVDVSLE